ncbi:hypothetical protein O9K51_04046 [Purpureocillium lavendulum]|uniref:Uncharacterized protein n=1 Tax=Purpureocillium lavendulum TaxID=1247861 RepID=A0AB34FUA6_9HYPO|nr:hypothetical protein O9K51_04046 [Purpureocillium lavendulum]
MPGLEDTYHWALMVGPRPKRNRMVEDWSIRFHAKQSLERVDPKLPIQSVWQYEEAPWAACKHNILLARIGVAKINDAARLREVFESVPLRPDVVGWNCVSWVKEALAAADMDDRALGDRVLSWEKVRNVAMHYVATKTGCGRYEVSGPLSNYTPTWDILVDKEVTA